MQYAVYATGSSGFASRLECGLSSELTISFPPYVCILCGLATLRCSQSGELMLTNHHILRPRTPVLLKTMKSLDHRVAM
jgi:hypothetical protein